MDRLDHGLLNLPLNKRGGKSIDAEIDAWKKRQAAQEKAEARGHSAETAAERIKAKALIDALSAEDLAAHAARIGLTPKKAAKELARRAYWRPAAVIALLSGTTEQVQA